jgi:translation initiation factor IF-1
MNEVSGTVLEAIPSALYRVKTDDGRVLTASLSGVPKQTIVRVIPGDRVLLTVSELDPTRAKIKAKLNQ